MEIDLSNLRKEFLEETGHSFYSNKGKYINWLEQKLIKTEKELDKFIDGKEK